jgi:hypothetical protein
MRIFDHNNGIKKRQLFRRKLGKIAENCDHNIDPWSGQFCKMPFRPKTFRINFHCQILNNFASKNIRNESNLVCIVDENLRF